MCTHVWWVCVVYDVCVMYMCTHVVAHVFSQHISCYLGDQIGRVGLEPKRVILSCSCKQKLNVKKRYLFNRQQTRGCDPDQLVDLITQLLVKRSDFLQYLHNTMAHI